MTPDRLEELYRALYFANPTAAAEIQAHIDWQAAQLAEQAKQIEGFIEAEQIAVTIDGPISAEEWTHVEQLREKMRQTVKDYDIVKAVERAERAEAEVERLKEAAYGQWVRATEANEMARFWQGAAAEARIGAFNEAIAVADALDTFVAQQILALRDAPVAKEP